MFSRNSVFKKMHGMDAGSDFKNENARNADSVLQKLHGMNAGSDFVKKCGSDRSLKITNH